MNLLTFISESATTAEAAGGTAGVGMAQILSMIVPLAIMVLIFYFLIIRPEKKRQKETESMLNNLQVADEVVTNGGIIGRVISVQKDTVLIETGSDRTKIRVLKNAIAQNKTAHDDETETAEVKKSKGKTEIK